MLLPTNVVSVIDNFVLDFASTSQLRINQMILFGSYSKDTWNQRSDIDLAVICPREAWTELQGRIISFSRSNPDFPVQVQIGNNYGLGSLMYGQKQRCHKLHLFLMPQLTPHNTLSEEIIRRGVNVL